MTQVLTYTLSDGTTVQVKDPIAAAFRGTDGTSGDMYVYAGAITFLDGSGGVEARLAVPQESPLGQSGTQVFDLSPLTHNETVQESGALLTLASGEFVAVSRGLRPLGDAAAAFGIADVRGHATLSASLAATATVSLVVDGSTVDSGQATVTLGGAEQVSVEKQLALTAGSHTIVLHAVASAGTMTCAAGAARVDATG
jgi:hypothetical protein